MASDLGFIAHTAERQAHEFTSERPCDTLPQARLANAWRTHKAQQRTFRLRFQRAHGQIFQDAFFDPLQVIVILIQHLLRMPNIQVVLGANLPGQVENPVQIGAGDDVFRGAGGHAGQALQLALHLFARLLRQLGLLESVM